MSTTNRQFENIVLTGTFTRSSNTTGTLIAGNGTNFINVAVGTDGQVLVADSGESAGIKWDNTAAGGAGCVTVGTAGADFTTIAAAYAAGNDYICVITSVTETAAIDIASDQLYIVLNPGINVSNTIAAAATWFTGDTSTLSIVGAGVNLESSAAGISSRMTLQSGQALRSGTTAELQTRGVRYTGAGTNILISGSSQVQNCKFDGATRFDLDEFEQYLYVTNCFFEVPVQIDSTTGLDPKTAIVSNNMFIGNADITVDGVNDLVFEGNTLGRPTTDG